MHFKKLITAAVITLLPLAASAATLIVPVAGSADGANGSKWQSELTLHNSGPQALTVTIRYQQSTAVPSDAVAVTVPARGTKSIDDIVRTTFHREGSIGALILEVPDREAIRLAVGSRTYNVSAAGEFGQDIPVVNVTSAANAGDINVLAGPSSSAHYRFNFGLFATTSANVRWQIIRANGTIAATREVTYNANEHAQYNDGIHSLLGVDAQDNDSVYAILTNGRAIFYGSAINGLTGDPTFVPSNRTRDEIRINFVGIDIDENGTVDVADANHDGVLDAALEVTTSMFPSIFRVVAEGEFGETVTLQIETAPVGGALFITTDTIQMGAPGDLKGKTGQVVVRATAQGATTLLTIPVRYQ
jgi:hypothetical protein